MSGSWSPEELEAGYNQLFARVTQACRFDWHPERQADMERVLKNRPRYDGVQGMTNVPWYVIGAIHNLEASFLFSAHLHNGDDISRKTHTEPKGLPKKWEPPKSSKDWEESAVDALAHDGFSVNKDWSLERTLYLIEAYNGWGPRQVHKLHTPYLWSFSESYIGGKYDFDGHWNPNVVSDQCGAAVLIKVLQDAGHISPPI